MTDISLTSEQLTDMHTESLQTVLPSPPVKRGQRVSFIKPVISKWIPSLRCSVTKAKTKSHQYEDETVADLSLI